MLGFFEKTGEILAKCWDFFQKLLGFLKKVGKFLQNVGIFGRKLWFGQVGIFGKFGGDFQPEPSGNTDPVLSFLIILPHFFIYHIIGSLH